MKHSAILAAAFAMAAHAPQNVAAATAGADPFMGVWRNPTNSVHVKTYSCGSSMCGTVIWASEKQKEAARKAGTASLIGKQLFSEFVRGDDQAWRGKLFVPKQGRIFPGKVTMIDANTMEVRGCALGGLFCKSQTWTRLERAS